MDNIEREDSVEVNPGVIRNRYDRFVSAATTGLGQDKVTEAAFKAAVLGGNAQSFLEAIFSSDWLHKKVIELPIKDALKLGWSIASDDKDLNKDRIERMKVFKTNKKIKEAAINARLHGGAAIFVGVDDGNQPEEPVDFDRMSKVLFLAVADRYQIWPSSYYDNPLEPKFNEPRTYTYSPIINSGSRQGGVFSRIKQAITTQSRRQFEIHETRIVKFPGVFTTDLGKQKNNGWDDSFLLSRLDALKGVQIGIQSGAALFVDFTVKVVKMKGLAEILKSSDPDTDAILEERAKTLNKCLSNYKTLFLDTEEEFDKVITNLQGYEKLLDKYYDLAAGVADIPRSRLFSQQLGKLAGATEDTRMYFDNLAQLQEDDLKNPTTEITIFFMNEKGVNQPGEWKIKYPALWQDDNKTKSITNNSQAAADEKYIKNGVVSPEEVRKSRFGSSETNLATELLSDELPEKPKEEGLGNQPEDINAE